MSSYIRALEEVAEAASIIHNVASNAGRRAKSVECPHGYIPSYPSHAWWCDACFQRLESAFDDLAYERKKHLTLAAPDLARSQSEIDEEVGRECAEPIHWLPWPPSR